MNTSIYDGTRSQKSDNRDKFDFDKILKIFGKREYKTFSDNNKSFSQKDVIASIIDEHNTFAIIPTGGGKSLCYQAPSLYLDGITIVVSPLVELIHDQVTQFNHTIENYNDELKKDGKRPFMAIYPGMDDLDPDTIFERICSKTEDVEIPYYCLLYLSPEKLTRPRFMRKLLEAKEEKKLKIANIVIDEVHCLSMWGFSFRENYLDVLRFIRLSGSPIISAFTATVKYFDIHIIKELLGFNRLDYTTFQFFKCIALRKDLHFEPVKKCGNADNENKDSFCTRKDALISILSEEKYRKMNTIIYCTSVVNADKLYKYLKSRMKGRHIYKYHGEMNISTRSNNAQRFIQSKKNSIIVATKAFGMGIDKPDVQLVIHYDVPLSLEEYYQEVGRAARGENVSGTSIVLYEEGSKEFFSYGSYSATNEWVTELSSLKHFETTIFASRLNDKSRILLQSLPNIRLKDVHTYIENQLNPMSGTDKKGIISDSQSGIIEYLTKEINEKDNKALNDFLYDLDKIIYKVNVLHVANSKIANIIRWHPDEYELNTEKTIDIVEWKRKRKKDYLQFIDTDVEQNSLYIKIPNLKRNEQINHKAVFDYIDQGLSSLQKKLNLNNTVLYAVSNDASLIIKGAYKLKDGEWIEEPEDYFVRNQKTVKGILDKQRFQSWREYNPKEYMKNKSVYDFSNAFAYVHGQQSRIAEYKLSGNQKLSYFDMCVADAVYSLKYYGNDTIQVKDIWKILSGNLDVRFPRSCSKIETEIRDSLIKLYNTRIYIKDNNEEISLERFLPFSEDSLNPSKPESDQKGRFKLNDTPPLYRYSEDINGEIIKIPVTYFRPREYNDELFEYGIKPLMKRNPRFSIKLKGTEADYSNSKNENLSESIPVIILDDKAQGNNTNPQYVEFGKMTVVGRNEYSITVRIHNKDNCYSVKAVAWRSTIEDSVLLHYLLHRISIALARKRGDFIDLNPLLDLLDDYIPRSILPEQRKNRIYRKVLAFLCYYERISYIRFLAYVTGKKTHTEYFEVRHKPSVKYWRDENEINIQFVDILLKWTHAPGENLENFEERKNNYSKETLIRLENMEINSLKGVRILSIQ